MKLKYPLFLLVAALVAVSAGASVDAFSFRRYSPGEQLPDKIISAYQAAGDFNWLGTEDGLVRLDNVGPKLYRFNSADQTTIPGNIVYQVVKDESDNTWIMTDGGLALWNRYRDNFSRKGIKAVSALADGRGCYFGATDTLFRYDYATGQFNVAATFSPGDNFTVNSIFPWQNGDLLLFSKEKGVYMFSTAAGSLEKVGVLQGKSSAFFVDSRGFVWRSVFGRGVECFNSEFVKVQSFDITDSDLSSNTVLCFCEYGGDIWMGTENGGISIYNPEKETFSVLPCGTIISLSVTGGRQVLAGTLESGALIVSRNQMASTLMKPEEAGAAPVVTLPDGRTLFYNYPEGFCTVEQPSGNIRPFSFGFGPLETSNTEVIQLLSKGPGGTIFIHNSQQLFQYDPVSREITEYRIPKEVTGNGPIMQSAGGQSGKYFHNSRYIFTPDREGSTVRTLFDIGAGKTINSLSVDKDSTLWVATSEGFGFFEEKKETLIPVENSFIGGVRSVMCDIHGRVWLGTNSKLFLYNPIEKSFYIVDDLDGLSFGKFTPDIRLVTAVGDIIMGNESAFVRIDRNFTPESDSDITFELESVAVDGKRIANMEKFKVPVSSGKIDIAFSVHSIFFYNVARKYRFKIKHPDGEELVESDSPQVSLVSLRRGRYEVYASCSTKNAEWTDYELLTTFKVRTHWYLAWWFVLSLILLAWGGAYAAYKWYLRCYIGEDELKHRIVKNVRKIRPGRKEPTGSAPCAPVDYPIGDSVLNKPSTEE